jgi:hypothetical protein
MSRGVICDGCRCFDEEGADSVQWLKLGVAERNDAERLTSIAPLLSADVCSWACAMNVVNKKAREIHGVRS